MPKVDDQGTKTTSDDRIVRGATFQFLADDGDGRYEPDGDDAPVLATIEAPKGFAVYTPSGPGDYWVVEAAPPEGLDVLDGDAEGLLAEHVLSGFERADRRRDVKRIAGRYDHRLDLGVGEHRIVVGKRLFRRMHRRHPREQFTRYVADGEKLCVRGLGAGLEMRRLGNLAAAQHADLQLPAALEFRHVRCCLPALNRFGRHRDLFHLVT